MCKLCDKIYSVTQTLPELEDYIQRDPEGVMQLNVLYYNHVYDEFYTTSRSIFFCPECGRSLY
jgi:hypothetical protein